MTKGENPKDIAPEVKAFLDHYIESYGQLQVLLLLSKEAGRTWTGAAVAQELRTNESAAQKCLDELTARGLAVASSDKPRSYQYKPSSPELGQAVAALSAAHATYHLRIIALIYERPAEKLRAFADAFKIRKDDDNG